MLTQESRDKPTPTWSIGLQQKLQKLLEKKSCSFGIMGKSLWKKKLFHKWEYEKKDKEEELPLPPQHSDHQANALKTHS